MNVVNKKWNYKKLGDVCTVERGGSPRPIDDYITDDPSGINWIKIGDTNDESMFITQTAQKILPEGMKKSRYVRPGDFLLSNSMSFGRPYILKIDGCIHDGWLVLRDKENVFDKRFLYYYLSSKPTYQKFKMMAVGGVVNNLNSEMVRGVDVPIPGKDEQVKIADVLDKISRIIAYKKKELVKSGDLIKARFVEMFGDPVSNPKNWDKKALSEVAEIKIGPFGSLLHKEDYITGGHALINPSHIIDGKISIDNNLTISDDKYEELNAYHLKIGDVVMGRRGEMGRCAVVDQQGLLCGTGSLLIRSKGELSADYIQKIISFPSFKRTIEDMAVGQTMPNLNVPIVSMFQMIKPPKSVQDDYYRFVAQVDKSKSIVQKSLNQTQLLFDSLMQQYFG